jgi:hypothetical protein
VPYPCFKCDVELVAGARYCHQCGAPNLLQPPGRRAAPEAPVEEEERYRIKKDIQEAAAIPTGTRMLQTVLPPPPPRSREPIKPKSPLERAVESRFWTRSWMWAGLGALAFLVVSSTVIVNLKENLQDDSDLNRTLTRLATRCPKESKAELLAQIAAIQRASVGTRSTADAALLLDVVTAELPITDGSCAKLAERLAKPQRFAPLAQ